MFDYTSRYPVPQADYLQKTGRLLAHRLGQLFNELGYFTWICEGQNKGVDLKVFDRYWNLVLVAEILNWSPRTNIPHTRKRKIIDNLSRYDCHRVLIYTAMGNENNLNELGLYNISIIKIGYQILPKFFYSYFEAKNQLEGRKIDSRETTLQIKSIISEYLQSLRLTTLVTPANKARTTA